MTEPEISQHFNFKEFVATDSGIFAINNQVYGLDYVGTLRALAYGMLEPIRHHFGQKIIIHSGIRCPALNAFVGGSPESQHVKAEAVDFHVENVECEDVFQFIWRGAGFPIGQVIHEFNKMNNVHWVHLSLGCPWRTLDRCGMVLRRFNDGHYELLDNKIRL